MKILVLKENGDIVTGLAIGLGVLVGLVIIMIILWIIFRKKNAHNVAKESI